MSLAVCGMGSWLESIPQAVHPSCAFGWLGLEPGQRLVPFAAKLGYLLVQHVLPAPRSLELEVFQP